MKYQLSALAAAVLLAGCGGSGSGGSDTSAPTYSLSGTVTAQAANGNEKVCADLNGDFRCDSGEPSTTSQNGAFTITSTNKAILESPLVVALDTGISSLSRDANRMSSANAFLVAPGQRKTSGNQINAITTLVAGQMAAGASLSVAVSNVIAELKAMGLPASNNLLNEGDSNDYATLEQNMLTLIAAMDKSKADAMLAALSSNLSDYQDVILATAPTDEMMNALLAELVNATAELGHNDTGIVSYFSDAGDSPDPQADYPGQDADFGYDHADGGFKLTKLDANGQPLSADAEEWSCVRDERTGLVWESKVDDAASPQFKDRLFVYQVSGQFEPYAADIDATGCKATDGICSTEEYVAYLNQHKVCGIDQWRLPTFGEYYDLIDFGETQTDDDGRVYGLTTQYFPRQSVASEFAEGEVWTSTEFFTEYDAYKVEGARYIQIAQTRGETRGITYGVEIYSDQVEAGMGTSYQLPIRLVSKEAK
ncbi:Lcl domain-containing protein [Vibrio sp. V39_P1S14PM300]|uniref:Lcl domain-containing protein n=1 Tax=Vibrio sp. V39_P1S14PM300 TaxID=1938690 RepID=UPI001372F966|nr:DUF1566 domain-containing protein [Vibrio sp. V39_P1S14PM300]NAX22408.1 DUF1566 domain-containing protein [Vibrio sp. V39_P1S14PM300]